MEILFDIPLKRQISVWYHKQDESSWEKDSYIMVYKITTIRSLIQFRNSFYILPQFLNGYYFFMFDDIFPKWEDPKNRNGGCYNINIPKDDVDEYVWETLYLLISERISETINGISIVPKKYNAILRLWNCDVNRQDLANLRREYFRTLKDDDIYFRSHVDNNHFGISNNERKN